MSRVCACLLSFVFSCVDDTDVTVWTLLNGLDHTLCKLWVFFACCVFGGDYMDLFWLLPLGERRTHFYNFSFRIVFQFSCVTLVITDAQNLISLVMFRHKGLGLFFLVCVSAAFALALNWCYGSVYFFHIGRLEDLLPQFCVLQPYSWKMTEIDKIS